MISTSNKLPLFSMVKISKSISEWYLLHSYESWLKPGKLELDKKEQVKWEGVMQMMMCHQLGEPVNSLVIGYGAKAEPPGSGDNVLLLLSLGDWRYSHYFNSNELTLLKGRK